METPKIDFYLGSVHEVIDRVTYEITADIPGVAQEVKAYPWSRGEMDEPVAGNLIYLIALDPVYHSVYLYMKAKENDFIGIRSNGKMIDITPDYISMGVYETDTTSKDGERPDLSKSYCKMDSEGNIEIMATGNEKITIKGDSNIEVSGNLSIKVSGTCDINSDGDCTIKSPNVTVTGGKCNIDGTVAPTGNGAFCGIPACLFTSAPHVGPTSSGT